MKGPASRGVSLWGRFIIFMGLERHAPLRHALPLGCDLEKKSVGCLGGPFLGGSQPSP